MNKKDEITLLDLYCKLMKERNDINQILIDIHKVLNG